METFAQHSDRGIVAKSLNTSAAPTSKTGQKNIVIDARQKADDGKGKPKAAGQQKPKAATKSAKKKQPTTEGEPTKKPTSPPPLEIKFDLSKYATNASARSCVYHHYYRREMAQLLSANFAFADADCEARLRAQAAGHAVTRAVAGLTET